MICARCQHFAAAPGGTLCARCAAAPAQDAAPAAQDAAAYPGGAPYPGAPGAAGAPGGPGTAGAFGAPGAVGAPGAFHAPVAPGAWLRPPGVLGRAAAVVLGLVAAADLFAVWVDLTVYDVADDLASGTYGGGISGRADHADRLNAAAGVVQTVALLVSVIVFLCWFHRVRVNAEVFNPFGHSKKRGWAIGAWFTPVVNLWFPRRITLDIWDASAPADRPRSHRLVNAWWAVWIVSLLADRAAFTAYRRADTGRELRDAAQQMVFADAVEIVAAVLAVLVVLRLTRMQDEKALRGPVPAAA